MAHYADLLRGPDGRTGYNAEDPDRVDNNVNWKFSLGARPKKGIVSDTLKQCSLGHLSRTPRNEELKTLRKCPGLRT